MPRVLLASILVAGAVLTGAVVAHPADWCFDSGGVNLVAQDFVKPGKGYCKVVMGTSPNGYPVSGTACLNSAGYMLRVGYTIHYNGFAEIGYLNIPHPALTGGNANWIVMYDGFNEAGSGGASARVCSPSQQAIP